jgi:2-polyprenyl-3-methyl-5-hydroxy-6-metoxy-1,4-benzoquinol methylase
MFFSSVNKINILQRGTNISRIMNEDIKKQQDYYNKGWRKELYLGKEQRGNLRTNIEFLDEIKVIKPKDKILEIGCGIGSVVFELSKQGYDVIGTDISSEAITYGLEKYRNVKLEVQAAEELQFASETFDVVLSFDLFEHIARTERHVSEVFRVLKPGGYYLFQTPNKYSNVVFETLYHKSLKWRRAHPSLHTPGQLKKRLDRHGFDVRFKKMNPINEFTIAKLKKLGPVGWILRHIKFTKLPLCMQTNVYVIAQKR